MKKLLAAVLCLSLSVSAFPLNAMAAGRARAIKGVATIDGKPHANVMLRLRNLETGVLLASTAASPEGRFSFSVLYDGLFVVESVTPAGTIMGTSSAVALKAPTVMPIEVTVRSNAFVANAAAASREQGAAVGGAGVGGGLSTTAITVIAVGIGLGVTGLVVAKRDSSPSQ